jgi:uncharacterized protein
VTEHAYQKKPDRHDPIWVLLTSKHGDNAQSLALSTAAGIPFATRSLLFKPLYDVAKPQVRPTIHHLDLERSDALQPPWPDVVITTGRRASMAALWIKSQAGGRTKIALIGKPKAHLKYFDLVIAAAHYRLPRNSPNVCSTTLPLISVPAEKLEVARTLWAPRFVDLARPITALLLGGSTGARPLDESVLAEIFDKTRAMARVGTIYVVTSRRTPSPAVDRTASALPAGTILYRWKQADPDNPYLGLLACADRFIVSGDSVSMLVEAARLGKPLAIAALPPYSTWRALARRLFGSIGASRDFDLLHQLFYDKGWAVPLGGEFIPPASLPPDEIHIAARRLRELIAKPSYAPCG